MVVLQTQAVVHASHEIHLQHIDNHNIAHFPVQNDQSQLSAKLDETVTKAADVQSQTASPGSKPAPVRKHGVFSSVLDLCCSGALDLYSKCVITI